MIFNIKKLVRIETNISDLAIKACLLQKHKNSWHPMVYLLRKLSLAKQNYNIYNKELLAIVVALKTQRVYVEKLL